MLAAHPPLARLGLRPLGSVAPAASVGWVEELGVPLAPVVEVAVPALTALPEWVRWQRPTVPHCHHWRRAWRSVPLFAASWRQGQTCVASAGQTGATVSEQNPRTHARTNGHHALRRTSCVLVRLAGAGGGAELVLGRTLVVRCVTRCT